MLLSPKRKFKGETISEVFRPFDNLEISWCYAIREAARVKGELDLLKGSI